VNRIHITRSCLVALGLWALTVSASLDAHDPIGTRVTWTGAIARIFQARCVGCHKAGSVDPMPLTTYEEAQPWTAAIRHQVLLRKMPIWHAARGFGAFANDPSLSPVEIALIAAWANAGGPRGIEQAPVVTREAVPERPAPKRVAEAREVSLACGTQALAGQLLAVTPQLEKAGSATITAFLPDGQREIIAWIRDYDPRYPTTYWLRTPLGLPRGSRLDIASTGECRMKATLARQ
jgi:hypothetical protein